jgi:hypothetical protein
MHGAARRAQPRRSDEKPPGEAAEYVGNALKRAFPLPSSGEFSDLLDAIGLPAEQPRSKRG